MDKGEIVLYQSQDGVISMDVLIEKETVWLPLERMATLFQRDKSTISRHIRNVFDEGELDISTVANFATVQLDLSRHNAQYEPISVKISNSFHDRFLIVDDVVYLIGASLKDIGKKLFAFSKMEMNPNEILKNVSSMTI